MNMSPTSAFPASAVPSSSAAPVLHGRDLKDPSYQAYLILWLGFLVFLVVSGIDKQLDLLAGWDQYLSPIVTERMGLQAHAFMRCVGVGELVCALVLFFSPRIGGWIIGLWMIGIIVNLLTIPAFYDIVLRDFGLAFGGFALARLGAAPARGARPA